MFPYPINDLVNELADNAALCISENEMSMKKLLFTIERLIISKMMNNCGGKKSLISRRLGISRVKLDYKLKEYGLNTAKDA
jgi:DNA-binding NtrC family response regulator